MALKTQKLLEIQVNETIHKNISVLTYFYPPHKDFWDVFKKDMFVKNNKSAFIHVVYYLLHVLNPDVIKENIPSWPVLDVSYERQFRLEVMKYLNKLNDIYENANMPSIMASQLVSPGGLRFAKYILKLSILVMRQSLLDDVDLNRKMLVRNNVHKNGSKTEKHIKKIEVLTLHINQGTKKTTLDFHNNYMKLKDKADIIIKKLKDIKIKVPSLQQKLKDLKSQEDSDASLIFDEKFNLLMENLSKVKTRCDELTKCKDLLDYLTKGELVLQNESSQELDLMVLFEKFNMQMEKRCLEMENLTDLQLDSYMEKFTNCNELLSQIKSNMDDVHKEWINLSAEVKKAAVCPKIALEKPNLFPVALSSRDSTVLAEPLDISESV